MFLNAFKGGNSGSEFTKAKHIVDSIKSQSHDLKIEQKRFVEFSLFSFIVPNDIK